MRQQPDAENKGEDRRAASAAFGFGDEGLFVLTVQKTKEAAGEEEEEEVEEQEDAAAADEEGDDEDEKPLGAMVSCRA